MNMRSSPCVFQWRLRVPTKSCLSSSVCFAFLPSLPLLLHHSSLTLEVSLTKQLHDALWQWRITLFCPSSSVLFACPRRFVSLPITARVRSSLRRNISLMSSIDPARRKSSKKLTFLSVSLLEKPVFVRSSSLISSMSPSAPSRLISTRLSSLAYLKVNSPKVSLNWATHLTRASLSRSCLPLTRSPDLSSIHLSSPLKLESRPLFQSNLTLFSVIFPTRATKKCLPLSQLKSKRTLV